MKTKHRRTKPFAIPGTPDRWGTSQGLFCGGRGVESPGDHPPDDTGSFSRIKSKCLEELDFTVAPRVLSTTRPMH